MKQVNIGIRHGLAILINDTSYEMTFSLMGAFHIDVFLPTLNNTDRIEASDLHNGIGNRFALDVGRNAEFLQFVV